MLNQDSEIEILSRFVFELAIWLWQDELNPRVRCAFGNVWKYNQCLRREIDIVGNINNVSGRMGFPAGRLSEMVASRIPSVWILFNCRWILLLFHHRPTVGCRKKFSDFIRWFWQSSDRQEGNFVRVMKGKYGSAVKRGTPINFSSLAMALILG